MVSSLGVTILVMLSKIAIDKVKEVVTLLPLPFKCPL